MQELSITVKTANEKLTERHLLYDALLMTKDNPFLIEKVKAVFDRVIKDPHEESPKITVKSVLRWQE